MIRKGEAGVRNGAADAFAGFTDGFIGHSDNIKGRKAVIGVTFDFNQATFKTVGDGGVYFCYHDWLSNIEVYVLQPYNKIEKTVTLNICIL